MPKLDIDGLYDAFGSPEARRSFEDALIGRIREKLDHVHEMVRIFKGVYEALNKTYNEQFEKRNRSPEDEKAIDSLDKELDKVLDCQLFYENEWHETIAILWLLVGEKQIPDAYHLTDVDALSEVVAKYRERHEKGLSKFEIDYDFEVPSKTGKRRGPRPETRLRVLSQIREAIARGEYTLEQLQRGEIKIDSLAAQFGCSRTPVNAAIRELLSERTSDCS